MMTDLNALMIFARVAEAKSFSEAARRLAMPVSTVSRRVADLEREFGTRLLVRSTRSVHPTPEGAQVLREARSVVDAADALDHWKTGRRADLPETLRLAAPPSISDTLLAPLLGAFRLAFPDIEVKVFVSGRITEDFPNDIDLQIKIGPQRSPELGRQTLVSYRHQLVASPHYLRRGPLPSEPLDLLGHPLLAFAFPGLESTWTLTQRGDAGREVLRFRPHVAISDYAGLTSIMLAEGGIGDLPPVVQPDLLRTGQLVEVLPRWKLPVFDLCLVHPERRGPTQPMRAFKDVAGDIVPKLFPDLPT